MKAGATLLRHAVSLIVAAAACGTALSGCAGARDPMGLPLRETTRFEAEWAIYHDMIGPKSLAMAGEQCGLFVLGYAAAAATDADAVSAALQDCESRRRDRQISTPCRTIAIDNTPVADPEGCLLPATR